MSARQFCGAALQWTSETQQFRTPVVPVNPGEDEHGVARIDGHFTLPSSAGKWAMAGLWTLALGSMLAMTALPGMSVVARLAVQRAGYSVVAASFVCFLIAEVVRRQRRTRALIEIRAASAGPATADSIAALHRAAGGAAVWVIAEAGLAPDAISVAAERNVRCFQPSPERFREVFAESNVLAHVKPGDDPPPVRGGRRRRPAA